MARDHLGAGLGEGAGLQAVVGGGFGGRHRRPDHVAVAPRADHAVDDRRDARPLGGERASRTRRRVVDGGQADGVVAEAGAPVEVGPPRGRVQHEPGAQALGEVEVRACSRRPGWPARPRSRAGGTRRSRAGRDPGGTRGWSRGRRRSGTGGRRSAGAGTWWSPFRIGRHPRRETPTSHREDSRLTAVRLERNRRPGARLLGCDDGAGSRSSAGTVSCESSTTGCGPAGSSPSSAPAGSARPALAHAAAPRAARDVPDGRRLRRPHPRRRRGRRARRPRCAAGLRLLRRAAELAVGPSRAARRRQLRAPARRRRATG